MTAHESRTLQEGSPVYWRGDPTEAGVVTETSWDAVTITWSNGHVARVMRGDMREIQDTPTKPQLV